jgi:hypothetical protein
MMIQARVDHAATLLADGTVLITGGVPADTTTVLSSEIFDPKTGVSSQQAALIHARHSHTTTRLTDGRVLIVGGLGGADLCCDQPLDSTELFDPATGSFSAGPALSMPLAGHTATLLPNGKVLIAGGHGPFGGSTNVAVATNIAALYDPVTNTLAPTGSMLQPHAEHTATLLPNGTVLVAGGWGAGDTAEIYDPRTGSFTMTGHMLSDRVGHAAALLPTGQVLVFGGSQQIEVDGVFHFSLTYTAELYDPATRSFSATGSMTIARQNFTATAAGAVVLVAGGYDDSPANEFASAEIYR